jgi:Uroporphyrinogen decarboxylase (URO-D)
MNARERYLETILFGNPDRVPFQPGGPRESTLAIWRTQGMPADGDWRDHFFDELGFNPYPPPDVPGHGVNFRLMPEFESKILEHRDGHNICQDWKGNICEISDKFDPSYLLHAKDFVTRRWIKLPVESRADWDDMRRRYDVETPGRYPDDFADRLEAMKTRRTITSIDISGPFWQLREWVGFEGLCMLLIDDPAFVREMVGFWTEFCSRAMAPILAAGVIDVLAWSEDMAYKEKPMISPAMTREFLQPCYDRLVGEARAAGVRVFDMDSDGRIDELIPVWIESGFNCCNPIEIAAGNDVQAMRDQFGHSIALRGGVDKRAIAKGGSVIEAELARVEPVIRDGGYIPGCDHGVPPDISWPDFLRYSRLLAAMTGWL